MMHVSLIHHLAAKLKTIRKAAIYDSMLLQVGEFGEFGPTWCGGVRCAVRTFPAFPQSLRTCIKIDSNTD